MESTLYFKDMRDSDHNNFPKKIYKVEQSRMLIEILDCKHINGNHTILQVQILEMISLLLSKILF